jgi:hypothetical protein
MKTEFIFAGFAFPRHVARMACGKNELRKKWAGRKFCGEYYHAPTPNSNGKGFYLNSDGQPFTRWEWCDDVINTRHTGWFCDEHGGTIRGIVIRLTNGKFLAGWSMGESMASTVEADAYDDRESAAYAADSMAENAAELERDYQNEQPN